MNLPLFAITQVICATGWTGGGIESDINKKIAQLDATIDHETQTLTVKDIKVAPEWGYAFIIYDIDEKKKDAL